MAILTEVRDPRVRDVTVTGVEMAPDMRSATVHVSIMGGPAREKLALQGLGRSAGFLQSKTPRLRFELDGGVKKSIEIARMLSEVLPTATATDHHQPDDHSGEHPQDDA